MKTRCRPGPGAVVAGALLLAPLAAVSMPNDVRIPVVRAHPAGTPPDAALFRHGRHGQFNCYACHPSLFPRYPLGFTHADMKQGRRCGACHDGSGARAVDRMTCTGCHVPG